METEMKLERRMFYGQKVSIFKFKFSLSSLVLHCYLYPQLFLFLEFVELPTGIIKRLERIREKPHVYVVMKITCNYFLYDFIIFLVST